MTPVPRARPPLALLLLLGAGIVIAYANTLGGPFVFDDIAAVTRNPSIETLATAFFPPDGLSVTGRPLVNASLALNFALSGHEVWSYHALNLALHLGCAALLYTLLRRLATGGAAAAVAGVWALHPLQTGTVTYVMQRSELLVSFCLLGTLAAFARATAAAGRSSGRVWLGTAIAVCAAGMAAKEVMAVAPLLVLLYDRTFGAGSLAGAWRGRRSFYLGLAATWGVLAAVMLAGDNRGASAGFAAAMSWSDYALTQLTAIPHYLRLALWPAPLVFDYGTALVTDPFAIGAGAVVMAGLLGGTLAAWNRNPPVAFAGATFLLLLAPSSSIVPIATQTLAEHRVYLALAAPLALLILAVAPRAGRAGLPLLLFVTAACTAGTVARNRDYASVVDLWRDTAQKAPANARALYNLGLALRAADDANGAQAAFAQAVVVDATHRDARRQLALLLLQRGRPEEALVHQRALLAVEPTSAPTHYAVAVPLLMLGRTAEALPHLQESVRLDPARAEVRFNLGRALAELGRYAEALVELDAAARLDPTDESARQSAARVRQYLGR
jgi:Flp pilus assembly protein TadD